MFIEESNVKITELGLKNSAAQLLPPNSLLVCTRATIGKAAIVKKNHFSTNQGFKNIVIARDFNVDYIYYQIVFGEQRMLLLGTGSTFFEVTKNQFDNFQIPLPSNIFEQSDIAAVLSDIDEYILSLERLIAKKKAIKQGAMQNLLTGKIRLKGFEGEWVEKKLGEACNILRGGSPRPIQFYLTDAEDGINWIKIGDVDIEARYITETKEKIISSGVSISRRVFIGDFILSNSMSFGRPYILKIDGCIHDGWLVIQNYEKTFDINYLC